MADEELLTVATLRGIDLSATRFAMLAACESGHIDRSAPDEFVGLPTGLLEAGVPAVAASLWPVEAAATRRLVARCFELLLRGDTPAAALRQAQLDMRQGILSETVLSTTEEPRDERNPFYWAAFTLTGA